MIRLTVEVDGGAADVIGAKEEIAAALEKLGRIRVVKVELLDNTEQLKF